MLSLRSLGNESFADISGVLCDAFADYPVMRYVVGTESGNYPEGLTALVGFFVTARLLRKDAILGVFDDAELSGVAMITLPGTAPPPAFDAAREEVWATLGPGARDRYETFSRGWQAFVPSVPHVHLDMLGVRGRSQRRGIGRLLLDRVHEFSRDRPDSQGVTLTTENPANVELYRHFGYQLTGHVRIAPELESWGMFRPD
jgi:GNAT superfamily N-acetyltransferase